MRGKEVFLKYDGWNGDERILLFSTDKCLDLLVAIKNWGCDATFDVVPLLFDQLWILFVRLAHSFVPVVFCLMNRRLESSSSQDYRTSSKIIAFKCRAGL
uniref:Uncharacterized protein n=1 Tax=Ditylenchus dipsaci TaxID=166011 RepID=A0A915CS34_9BILA